MRDYFISYSHHDQDFADKIDAELRLHGLNGFMANNSLRPGDDWAEEVLKNLREARWVLFLASEKACDSAYVQQELGGALLSGQHKIVPIVWDMPVEKLPGWVNRKQALDLRHASAERLKEEVAKIADGINADKRKGLLIVGGLLTALLLIK